MTRATWPRLLLLVVPLACNQVLGIPEPARETDGGAAIEGPPDADPDVAPSPPPVPPGACAPDAEVVSVVPVGGVNTAAEEQNAWLSRNELTIVFSRVIDGRLGDLHVAHRAHRGDDFGEAVSLDTLNSVDDEFASSMSDDGRTIYFDRYVTTTGWGIFVATRAGDDGPFDPPTRLKGLSEKYENFEPFITLDDLLFSSRRGDGIPTLYGAARSGATLATPRVLVPTPAETADESPVLSFDGLTLYFSRADASANQGIWSASRPARDRPLGPPRPEG
jgi:hypothetical protein